MYFNNSKMAKYTFVIKYYILFVFFVNSRFNCNSVNCDFVPGKKNYNLEYQQRSNKNNFKFHQENLDERSSNRLFMLILSFPLETYITEQLVYH